MNCKLTFRPTLGTMTAFVWPVGKPHKATATGQKSEVKDRR